MRFLRITILLLVCLFSLGIEVAFPRPLPDNPLVLNEFFNLLESTSGNSSQRILKLKAFIEEHPSFERAYLILLETCVADGKVPEAESYFQQLSINPQTSFNSDWMLAKIFSSGSPDQAAGYYNRALNRDTISIAFIEDFLKFKQKQSEEELPNSSPHLLPKKFNMPDRLFSGIFNYISLKHQQAIDNFSRLPKDDLNEVALLDIYSECYLETRDLGKAESVCLQGVSLTQKSGDLQYRATFFEHLGSIYHRRIEYEQAISYYDSALTIANRIGDLQRIQLITGRKATTLRFQGNFSDALLPYKNAIEIAKKLRLNSYLFLWYFGEGQAFYNLEKYSEALASYDSCSNILEIERNSRLRTITEYCKADIYKELGQYNLARKVYRKAYELAAEGQLAREQYKIRRKLADLITIEKLYSEAVPIYRECLDHSTGILDQCYIRKQLADIYIIQKKYQMAREQYQKALKKAREAEFNSYVCWCLIGLSNVDILTGNIQSAMKRLNTALEIADEVARNENDVSLLIGVQIAWGDAFAKSGRLPQAIQSYKQAVELIERSRKSLKVVEFRVGYFGKVSEVYQKLVNSYYRCYTSEGKKTDLDSMFYYIEMARSRSLKDWKYGNHENDAQFVGDKTYLVYQKICRQLSAQQRLLREKASRLYSDKELEEQVSRLEILQTSLLIQRLRLIEKKPDSQSSSQTILKPLSEYVKELRKRNLGLLLYHINPETSFVLAVSDDSLKVVPLNAENSTLDSLISTLMEPFHSITERNAGQTPFRAGIAYRLYNLLIKPVEAEMTLPQRLLIIPDISLMNLPFEMLLTGAPKKAVYTPLDEPEYAVDFLVQRYTMVYSPSIVLLEDRSKLVFSEPDVLIFANPFDYQAMFTQPVSRQVGSQSPDSACLAAQQMPGRFRYQAGWRFDPLPYSLAEAERIKALYSSTEIYRESQATELAFKQKAAEYGIIHIATHGFVNPNFDAFSGLVLAPANDPLDDGMYMGYEISNLKLKSDLVVLSACETGQGRLVSGEGVLGLPRLFFGAGAKSVLMTLWKVDDLFTSRLMPEFYNRLLNKNLSKSEALTGAKRMMLQSNNEPAGIHYQHPLYWASFVLYGDPGTERSYFPLKALLGFVILAVVGGAWAFRRKRQKSLNYSLPV